MNDRCQSLRLLHFGVQLPGTRTLKSFRPYTYFLQANVAKDVYSLYWFIFSEFTQEVVLYIDTNLLNDEVLAELNFSCIGDPCRIKTNVQDIFFDLTFSGYLMRKEIACFPLFVIIIIISTFRPLHESRAKQLTDLATSCILFIAHSLN